METKRVIVCAMMGAVLAILVYSTVMYVAESVHLERLQQWRDALIKAGVEAPE